MKVAITGANGFVGRALTASCRAAGVEVLRLVRSNDGQGDAVAWQLGQPLPKVAHDADAIIHLASAVIGSACPEQDVALDVDGTLLLAQGARELRQSGHGPRFVFVSSQSAGPQAATAYGRSKWTLESLLLDEGESIVRPGLVYGGVSASVYATLERLASLPALPIVKMPAAIQPIHVDDLATCLLQIASTSSERKTWMLGRVRALTLEEVIRIIALRNNRRVPLMVPAPVAVLRMAARCADALLRPSNSFVERLDGFVLLHPMDTSPSLAELGRILRPFEHG